jgi:hypothetical protein
VTAALIYALCVNIYASSVPTSGAIVPASGKPFVVSWAIRWKPPLAETTHSKRFAHAREAVGFELAAPLCSSQAPPCVVWIKADVVAINPKFKTAAQQKGSANELEVRLSAVVDLPAAQEQCLPTLHAEMPARLPG